jgi:hypothetical protein
MKGAQMIRKSTILAVWLLLAGCAGTGSDVEKMPAAKQESAATLNAWGMKQRAPGVWVRESE